MIQHTTNKPIEPIKYRLYAEDKDGWVTVIGDYDDLSSIMIRTSLFADGTTITIDEITNDQN